MPVEMTSVSNLKYEIAPSNVQPKDKRSFSETDKNPVSRAGEASLLVKGTFFAGVALGCRLLFELFDGDFLCELLGNKAKKIVNKNKNNVGKNKKLLLTAGAAAGLIGVAVVGFGLLYTAFNAPKIAYKSKVNQFKKSKEIDVYIQGNKAERELYSQINKKSLTADEQEKDKLRENYMQLKLAKNKVPDFVLMKPLK